MNIKIFDKQSKILIGEGNLIQKDIIYLIYNNLDDDFIVTPFNLLEKKISEKFKRKIEIQILKQ